MSQLSVEAAALAQDAAPVEEPELATYQEALVEVLLLAASPEEQLRLLAADPRARPFAAYVASIDLRCLEVTSRLMKLWAERRQS